jgi:pyrroloquinoline quinone biosynthesis protein B
MHRQDFHAILEKNEYLLLDATFYDPNELPGRDLSRVPHPFVRDTVRDLKTFAKKITLIHLNHSNPLWRQSPERKIVEDSWFTVGEPGMTWIIN